MFLLPTLSEADEALLIGTRTCNNNLTYINYYCDSFENIFFNKVKECKYFSIYFGNLTQKLLMNVQRFLSLL